MKLEKFDHKSYCKDHALNCSEHDDTCNICLLKAAHKFYQEQVEELFQSEFVKWHELGIKEGRGKVS